MTPNLTAIHAVLNDSTLKFVDAAPGLFRALPAEVPTEGVCYSSTKLAALLSDFPEEVWESWLDWKIVVDRDLLKRLATSPRRDYGA
jgi:hypothetical protein